METGAIAVYYSLNYLIFFIMDKNLIAVNAAKVWRALGEVRRISIPELAGKVNLSIESTTLAIGWLACENKIRMGGGLVEACGENRYEFCFG